MKIGGGSIIPGTNRQKEFSLFLEIANSLTFVVVVHCCFKKEKIKET